MLSNVQNYPLSSNFLSVNFKCITQHFVLQQPNTLLCHYSTPSALVLCHIYLHHTSFYAFPVVWSSSGKSVSDTTNGKKFLHYFIV